MPSAWGFAIDVNAARVCKAKGADIGWENERKTKERNAELGRAEQ